MTKAAGPRAAARALLFAGLASGCASATASPAARTCVVEAPARRTDLEVQELVTVDRGVRWLHAWKLGLGGLAWLRADGELGFVALDSVAQLHSGDFDFWRWRCTPEAEGALRCFNGPTRRDDGTWTPFWSRRVELSDTPRLGELERWEAPPGPVDRVASDGRLAVTIRRGGDQGELRLWDVAARAPTADAPVWLKGQIETLATPSSGCRPAAAATTTGRCSPSRPGLERGAAGTPRPPRSASSASASTAGSSSPASRPTSTTSRAAATPSTIGAPRSSTATSGRDARPPGARSSATASTASARGAAATISCGSPDPIGPRR